MVEAEEKPAEKSKAKTRLFLALKIAVSGGLVWLLFSSVDIADTMTRLKGATPGYLLLAAIVLLTQTITNTLRWTSVLEAVGKPLGFWNAYRVTYIGLFFNQTLPSAVGGDAFRIYLANKSGTGIGKAANSVLIERVITVLALVMLVAFTQPLLLSRIEDTQAKWVFPLLAFGAVAGIIFLIFLERLPEHLHRWRIIQAIAALGSDTKTVFLTLKQASLCIFWSLYGHASLSLMAFLIGQSLGLDIGLIDCLVLVPPVILVMTIPISIAGWGVREGAMIVAFGMIGIERADALSLSIIFGLLTVAVALPGGLVWLNSGERKNSHIAD